VKDGDASRLAIQERGDLPITAKRVAGYGLYKLTKKTNTRTIERGEVGIEQAHTLTHNH
jgi:hypothetical protein